MPYQNPQKSNLFKKMSVPNEIHLRRDKVVPAIERLKTYIEDAKNAGMKEIRVIHGRAGSGDMRRAVHESSPFILRLKISTLPRLQRGVQEQQ